MFILYTCPKYITFEFTRNSIFWVFLRKSVFLNIGSQKSCNLFSYPKFPNSYNFEKYSIKVNPLPKSLRMQYATSRDTWSLFLQSWTIFRPKVTSNYAVHYEFRLMFLADSGVQRFNSLLSAQRYFHRWLDSYNLLFNLFYVEAQIQMVSNNLFIEETLLFNWDYNFRNFKIFKFSQPFFIFKDLSHGVYLHEAFLDILIRKMDLILAVDLANHNILLNYSKRYSFFSVGLVPINYSPWSVSYPIPVFSESMLTQYYFIKLILAIRADALSKRYQIKYNNWQILQKAIFL